MPANPFKAQQGLAALLRIVTDNPAIGYNAAEKMLKAQGLSYGSRQQKQADFRQATGREKASPVPLPSARLGGRRSGLSRTTPEQQMKKRTAARSKLNKLSKDHPEASQDELLKIAMRKDKARSAEQSADDKLLRFRAEAAGYKVPPTATYIQILQVMYPEQFGEPEFEGFDEIEYAE